MIPGFDTNKAEVLKQRSATQWADKMNKSTPLLIVQGSSDWRVPSEQVFILARQLYETRHPMRFIFFEGGQHSMAEHTAAFYDQALQFLNSYVRDGKKWPDLKPHGE